MAGFYLNKISQKSIVHGEDIQSLADLSASFETARDMNILPFGFVNVLQLFLIAALPFFTLVVSIFPLQEIIKCMLRMFI